MLIALHQHLVTVGIPRRELKDSAQLSLKVTDSGAGIPRRELKAQVEDPAEVGLPSLNPEKGVERA